MTLPCLLSLLVLPHCLFAQRCSRREVVLNQGQSPLALFCLAVPTHRDEPRKWSRILGGCSCWREPATWSSCRSGFPALASPRPWAQPQGAGKGFFLEPICSRRTWNSTWRTKKVWFKLVRGKSIFFICQNPKILFNFDPWGQAGCHRGFVHAIYLLPLDGTYIPTHGATRNRYNEGSSVCYVSCTLLLWGARCGRFPWRD